jgi:ubiquitin-like 1-activating enzyme E1 A
MDSDFILKEEAEVYDRQLRLWGLPAQKKIKNSRLCVSGLSALAGEVCKNLILAGIGELTLLDVTLVDAGDIYGNYLFSAEDIDLNVII